MKKLFVIVLLVTWSIMASFAQTQQGIVKTRGRMMNGKNVPGKGLPNALVAVKGCSKVLTQGNGTFSFPPPSQTFTIDSVKKKGYQLVDADATRQSYHYSPNKLYLVMETPEQQMEDLLDAQENINRTLQDNLRKTRAELKKLHEEKKISDDEYLQRIDKLMEEQNKSQKLVEEMAKEYAAIDYDQLEGINRRICDAIAHGRLLEADSLLRSKGDMKSRKKVIDMERQVEAKRAAEIAKEQELLEASKAGTQKKIEDAADDCYRYFDRFRLANQHDSAAFYIEFRAELDTTRADWQIEAGSYNEEYLSEYEKAISYYDKALKLANLQEGENSNIAASAYNNMGTAYSHKSDFLKAMECYRKALDIRLKIYGTEHADVALLYSNIGTCHAEQNDFEKALEFQLKALAIRENAQYRNSIDLASSYNNIGFVYKATGDYAKALDYYTKALELNEKVLGRKHLSTALSYNNLGSLYQVLGKHQEAIECYTKAMVIFKEIYVNDHPDLATSYNNLGSIYSTIGKYGEAVKYHQMALSIRNRLLGENHEDVAASYNNLGVLCHKMDDDQSALKNLTEAIAITEKNKNVNRLLIAQINDNMGVVLSSLDSQEKAIPYYKKALAIREEVYGKNNVKLAQSYSNMGVFYDYLKDYDTALHYFTKSLSIIEQELGPDHYQTAESNTDIGAVYNHLGNYDKAEEHYLKALTSYRKAFGEEHPTIASVLNNMGTMYFEKGEHKKAEECYLKALKIREKFLSPEHRMTKKTRENLEYVRMYIRQKEYVNAVKENKLEEYLSSHIFTATIASGDVPARQQGLNGDYILLEFADWTHDSLISLMDKNEEMQGKPKDIVLMKDNVISKHHFDNTIGAIFSFKEVSKEERQHINNLYEQWKKEHNNNKD